MAMPRRWRTGDALQELAAVDRTQEDLEIEVQAFDTHPEQPQPPAEVRQAAAAHVHACIKLIDRLKESAILARQDAERVGEKTTETEDAQRAEARKRLTIARSAE